LTFLMALQYPNTSSSFPSLASEKPNIFRSAWQAAQEMCIWWQET